ncbi:hypothetical protein SteCoe_33314 [Stentor coeruleus]|uniref:Ion transport domain-containing protein n=1 Tax=Stentor coeruleus TaxID=5963 RepID=A0A1R2AX08_9CILI|nr:hypothetical protein SteCoe_33314 [Stentor coeruleus]
MEDPEVAKLFQDHNFDQLNCNTILYSPSGNRVSPLTEQIMELSSNKTGDVTLQEEMEKLSKYLTEFKQDKIATPFGGIWMVLSKDSSRFYFSSHQGNISIARIDTKRTYLNVDLNEGKIWTIALCSNDKFLFSGGQGGEIKKFLTKNMTKVDTYKGHASEVNAIHISSDGETMYSAGDDRTVRKWDIKTSTSTSEILYEHDKPIFHIDLSYDDNYIASASDDQKIKVYSVLEKKVMKTIEDPDMKENWCVKITAKNSYIVFGNENSKIYLYKFGTWEKLKVFIGHTSRVRSITSTFDERFIISGGNDKNIFIWDVLFNRKGLKLEGHAGWVRTVIVSRDNNFLYSLSDDGTIRLWRIPRFDYYSIMYEPGSYNRKSLTDRSDKKKTKLPYGEVGSKIFTGFKHPENLYLVNSNMMGKIDKIGNTPFVELSETNNIFYIFDRQTDALCIISGENLIGYDYNTEDVMPFTFSFYDADNFTLINTLQVQARGIFSVMYSYDSQYIIIGEDKKCRILNAKDLSDYCVFESHEEHVTQLCLSLSGLFVFSADDSGLINCYNFQSKTYIKSIIDIDSGIVSKMVVSYDEDYLIVLHKSGKLNVWATPKWIIVRTINGFYFSDFQFCGENDILMCLNENKFYGFAIPSFSCEFEITLDSPAKSFAISQNLEDIYFYQENGIYVYQNPYEANTLCAFGDINHINKYYQYLSQIVSNKEVVYEKAFNTWIIEPFHINVLHFFCYCNKTDLIEKAMDDDIGFLVSKSGYSPLDICLYMNNKDVISMLYSKFKIKVQSNPYLTIFLENSINSICMHEYSKASKFLDLILKESIDTSLTRFIDSKVKLPIVILSPYIFCNQESFGKTDSKEEQSVEFLQTYMKINMVPGSNESLEFIRSLMFTSYGYVFYSEIIQIILEQKWLQVRRVLYFQAIAYVCYLILLSAYCRHENLAILIVCFILNILLLLYEFYQMSLLPYDYFTDKWNIFDIVNLLLMITMFFISIYNPGDGADFLVALVIFFAWIRGVSYFRVIKGTRYYINLLYQTIIDVIPFFTIFLYTTIAFSLIFSRLGHLEDSYYSVLTLTWEMNVGGFDSSNFSELYYLAFFIYMLLNPITMLNLLIAIMNDTFSKINDGLVVADSMELAQIIFEGEFAYFKNRNRTDKVYIHICKARQNSSEDGETIAYLKRLKRCLCEKIERTDARIENLEKSMIDLSDKISEFIKR